VVFLGIRPGQVPEEPQPEGLDPFRDWQAACSVPNRLICNATFEGVRGLTSLLKTNVPYSLLILVGGLLSSIP